MARILIVEDDEEISSLLGEYLSDRGHETVSAYDGLHALDIIREKQIDLVLLDIMLPFKSGDTVLTEIRNRFTLPVIILSARGTTQNKVELLHLGADDYVTKPFDLEEVLARVESNLRRVRYQREPERILQWGELTLDTGRNRAFLKGEELILTAKEYGILELLMEYPDKIFSKANLFESVWKEEFLCEDNTLNVHISNLRNKLKAVCPGEYIETVWGIGYRLRQG